MSTEPVKRPGLVTFAAILLFVIGGMHVVSAIEQISDAASLSNATFGLFSGNYAIWGIIDLVIAAAILFAGYDLLRGGGFGRWLAVIMASVSAIRSFWFFWWAPLAAMAVIAIDIAIIYAMVMHGDYFDQQT